MNRRLFVALDPPEAVRRRIGAVVAALRRSAGRAADEVRWTAAESLHLTLQFLGAVPEERIVELDGAVRAAAAASR
ncbi:MAG: 2'-5' RNA ligase family protein, partial [Anaeromyxobacteraceae bacterium]